MRDLAIVMFSVFLATYIIHFDLVQKALIATKSSEILSSFIAGIFFTSVFTTVPAIVVLGEIAAKNSILLVAIFGALGALCGDFILFRFIKRDLSEDIAHIASHSRFLSKLKGIFKRRVFRWFIPLIGALILASPLPDELGLALMGLSKMKLRIFIPISLIFNFLGILVIGLVADSLIN